MEPEDRKKSAPDPAGAAEWAVGVEFSLAELLEVAVWMERTGVEFYRMLSEETADPGLRNFFLRLMGMEMEHERKLMDRLHSVPAELRAKMAFDEALTGREYFLKLRALTAQLAYPDALSLFHEIESFKAPHEALPLAIKAERNMIKCFQRFKRFRLAPAELGLIDELIAEEEGHVEEVSRILRKLERAAK